MAFEIRIHLDFEPVTIEDLRLAPKLNREFVVPKRRWDYLRYNNEEIEHFYSVALSLKQQWNEGWNFVRGCDFESFNNRPRFEKNCGEWVILDKPKLAACRYIREEDGLETLTPVSIMTVTNDGNDAHKVYLPLGECCCVSADEEDKNNLIHYYQDGFKWRERPFEQIMKSLSKGKIICYTYCTMYYINHKSKQFGGFRIL